MSFLLLLLPLGCSTRVLGGRLEKRIASRLRSLIGPANHYTVRIRETRDTELVLGRLRRVEVEGIGVLAGGEFRIESLRVQALGVRFEGGTDDLVSVRESHVDVEVAEEALNDYLQRTRRRSQRRIRLNDGTVTYFGTVRMLGATAPVETTGRLEVAGGSQIVFRAEVVSAPDLRLPGDGTAFVERQVNPLVDLERLDWPVQIEAIRVEGGRIHLIGSLKLARKRQE